MSNATFTRILDKADTNVLNALRELSGGKAKLTRKQAIERQQITEALLLTRTLLINAKTY